MTSLTWIIFNKFEWLVKWFQIILFETTNSLTLTEKCKHKLVQEMLYILRWKKNQQYNYCHNVYLFDNNQSLISIYKNYNSHGSRSLIS